MPLMAGVLGGLALVLVAAVIWYVNGPKHPPEAKTSAVTAKQTVAPPATTTPMASTPAPEGIMAGCQALWTFDQDHGTSVIDATGNGYNATLVGNHAHWTKAARGGSGALSLGEDSYAQTAGPVLNTMKSFTVTAWVYLNTFNKAVCQTFVSIDGSEVSGFYLQLNANRFVFLRMEADSSSTPPIMARASMDAAFKNWYHLAGVYDANAQTLALYVNGRFQETVSFTKPWQAMGHTAIGRGFYQHSNRDFVNGMVNDVRFYAAALTPAEIQILAAK